ncbi:MAG TPA: hypothetical protein VIL46_14360, partial [Gemmataceae bacterium]
RYFLIVFGSQSVPKLPRYTHTWATAVKLSRADPEWAEWRVEVRTISWMPRGMKIRAWWLWPEKGVNLDLYRTLNWAVETGQRVSMWGPYEIRRELYEMFLERMADLEAGRQDYMCIDPLFWTGACNCIHAFTDIDYPLGRVAYPLVRFGESASRHIVRVLHRRDYIVRPEADHDWLNKLLKLDRYPIVRREYGG